MATLLSSVASGVASAATYTVGAVPAILTGTAAAAGVAGSAVAGAVSQSGSALKYAGTAAKGVAGSAVSHSGSALKYAGTAAKGVAGGTGVALAASTVGTVALKAVGFTAIGPAVGTYASAWMSSAAIANGGAIAAGSLYSVVQSTAMTGGVLLGTPAVLAAGAIGGAGAVIYKSRL